MAEVVMLSTVGFAGLGAVLAALLLAVQLRNYRRVRAPFTLGLLLIASVLLAQGLLAVYAYLTMMEIVPLALAPYVLGVTVLQTGALGLMLRSASQ